MIANHNGWRYECVVVDINTQRDFCECDGARPVANHEGLLPTLRRMIAWTKRNYAPLVSSIQSRRVGDVLVNERGVCCIDGSPGQKKIEFTIMPCRVQVEVDNTLTVSTELFDQCQQVIFRKRTDDLLANPKADRFLTHLTAREFLVFGNSLECDVKALALGLLARNKPVTIVRDACGFWDASRADLAIRQMQAKGAQVLSIDELLTRKLSRLHRYRPSEKTKTNGNGGTGNGARIHFRPNA